MRFGVLGPVAVSDGDGEIRLGGPKQRALLALLLIHRNEVVSRDRLIDGLWGDRPPASAAHTLDDYISRLRKVLGSGRVIRRPPGYVLRVDSGELDLDRFETLVSQGRDELGRGDARQAASTLRAALALRRGPTLADVVDAPFASLEVHRLEEQHLGALEDRIEVDLALGRVSEVVPELQALVRTHPLRERLRAQLMLGLYRSGRQAEALEEYRRVRSAFADELGIEPGRALRELERAILRQETGLDAPVKESRRAGEQERAIRGRAGVLTLAALLAGVVAVSVAARTGRGTGAPSVLGANSVGAIDPDTNRLVAEVRVGRDPVAVAGGRSVLWVANRADGTLSRIDPRRFVRTRTLGVTAAPNDVATVEGTAWVGGAGFERTLASVDADGNVANVKLPQSRGKAFAVAAVGRTVWVADGDSALYGVDASTRRLSRRPISMGNGFGVPGGGLALYDHAVWVSDPHENVVRRVDLRTGRTRTITLQPTGEMETGGAGSISAGEGSVWVVVRATRTLWRINPASNIAEPAATADGVPVAVAVGAGSVWLADETGTVARIDPATNRTVAAVDVGRKPTALTVAAGRVWVTVV
jgi:DNA-binding SARP family transcriptional activator